MRIFLEGFLLQASLIFVLGAQNLFVLESGLRKRRHLLVASLCAACDALLIALGVLGAAALFIQVPILKTLFGISGVIFLAYYGMRKLLEKPEAMEADGLSENDFTSARKIVLQTFAFSLLNPHVYLDAIVLIGGYSTKFKTLGERATFGAGAVSFSVVWFFSLSMLAAAIRRHLNDTKTRRKLSIASGSILLILAVKLGRDVLSWRF